MIPLTLAQQIAQMIVIPVDCQWSVSGRQSTGSGSPELLKSWVEDLGVGGICLSGGHVTEAFLQIDQLQTWARLPLLVGAELEAGAGQRFFGATEFTPLACLALFGKASRKLARAVGQITAREAVALGINWLLAPVTELPTDPVSLMSDQRLLGSDPELVAQLASAFIIGTQSEAILTTAKYFPSCGTFSPSSGESAKPPKLFPQLACSLAEFSERQGIPFQRAIAAGVSAIMSAHVLAWDEALPVSLSPNILPKLLRDQWQFQGLIVTDALDQEVLTRQYSPAEIAVRAVQAGSDLLLAPAHPEEAIQAIQQAVQAGEIPASQIEQSVTRILKAKQKVCPGSASLLKDYWPVLSLAGEVSSPTDPMRGVTPEQLKTLILSEPIAPDSALHKLMPMLKPSAWGLTTLQAKLGQPDALNYAQGLARGSIERIHADRLPLHPQPGWLNWIWVDEAYRLNARSPAISLPLAHQVPCLVSDLLLPLPLLEQALSQATGLIVQWFCASDPALSAGELPPVLHHLLQEHWLKVQVMVGYGSRSVLPGIRVRLKAADPAIPCLWALDPRPIAQTEVGHLLFAGSRPAATRAVVNA